MKTIAVILAGGSGSRLGNDFPKQFVKVAGKKIIEHTIDVFDSSEDIDEIFIVCKNEWIPTVEELVVTNSYKKITKILSGGKERYQSSLSAIEACEDDDLILFHDAVRPLVNHRIIRDCVEALNEFNAVDVAISATDTIIEVNSDALIDNIPDRSKLRNGQTPQGFKCHIIRKAYELALKDPKFNTSDDCGVVKRYLPDEPIYVVRGENFNMKLTYMEDLFLLDKLFQLKSISISKELSENTKTIIPNKVMVVFGGSYGIGKDVVDLARSLGAVVYSFSRSENNIDITDVDKVRSVLEEVVAKNGHIDYVVCTPGILIRETLEAISYDKIINSINVNLLGSIIVAKESFNYLKASKGSLAVYTSSSYTRGRMMYSIYSSSKSAIVNLTQALSEEWLNFGVRINCINPERTDTPMRRTNFGIEPEGSLLDPKVVAISTLNVLTSNISGEVVDVKI